MIDGQRERARNGQSLRERKREDTQAHGLGATLAKHGVRADAITALGVVLAGATAVAIGYGAFYLACVGLIVGGLMDTLDGMVAKAAGTSSARGAFLDSVSDRVADGLMFGGLAFYFIEGHGHDPRLALLPIAILTVSSIISYERAKAESLGFTARGGLMERAECLILFGLAMLIHVVLVPILIVLLCLSTATAIGRFVRVWSQASGRDEPVRSEVWKAGMDARWKRFKASGRESANRRSRREVEPLTTRLRGVWSADRVGAVRRSQQTRADRPARARRRRPSNTL